MVWPVNALVYPIAQMKPPSSLCPGVLDGKRSMILLMSCISHTLCVCKYITVKAHFRCFQRLTTSRLRAWFINSTDAVTQVTANALGSMSVGANTNKYIFISACREIGHVVPAACQKMVISMHQPGATKLHELNQWKMPVPIIMSHTLHLSEQSKEKKNYTSTAPLLKNQL